MFVYFLVYVEFVCLSPVFSDCYFLFFVFTLVPRLMCIMFSFASNISIVRPCSAVFPGVSSLPSSPPMCTLSAYSSWCVSFHQSVVCSQFVHVLLCYCFYFCLIPSAESCIWVHCLAATRPSYHLLFYL